MKKKCWMLTMGAVLTLSVAAMFTGCSNKNDATTTEKTTEGGSSTTASNNDLGDDVEDAADDVADGAKDLADDVANGFDDYDDAHDYLINKLGSDGNGQYEVRNKDQDVTEYRDGAKGYHFEIYDTSKDSGKKYGDFYVDKDNGKIYKKNTDTKKVEEYKAKK